MVGPPVARGQHGGDVMACVWRSFAAQFALLWQVREGPLGRARQSRAATEATSMCHQPPDSGDQTR